jgi:hypothetical protein
VKPGYGLGGEGKARQFPRYTTGLVGFIRKCIAECDTIVGDLKDNLHHFALGIFQGKDLAIGLIEAMFLFAQKHIILILDGLGF